MGLLLVPPVEAPVVPEGVPVAEGAKVERRSHLLSRSHHLLKRSVRGQIRRHHHQMRRKSQQTDTPGRPEGRGGLSWP